MTPTRAARAAGLARRLLGERPFFVGAGTALAFQVVGDSWLDALASPTLALFLFTWLFVAMLWAAFGVVRHADALAGLLGEPYGTLILTLAVIGIEVSLISAVMLSGEASPALARDTMYAALMIVLNGLVGGALLLGGLFHREQDYNLQGARSFLAVLLPLAVISLILPKFTLATDTPTFSPLQEAFFAGTSALLYAIFLGVQTVRHSGYFREPYAPEDGADGALARTEDVDLDEGDGATAGDGPPVPPLPYHVLLLALTLLPIVLLSDRLAELVDFGIAHSGAPVALGGVIIALMVLTPEGLTALRAARINQLQRSVNILLGAALSTIGLTVPAALLIGLAIGQPVVLGLDDASAVMLLLTLLVSALTFGGVRTNVLQGAIHLVLFLAYLLLIFDR